MLLHSKLLSPASPEVICAIVTEAVEIEHLFVREALDVSLLGMNADQMCQYVCFVADHLLVSLGLDPVYRAQNPFDWMEAISLIGKTNFFESAWGKGAGGWVHARGLTGLTPRPARRAQSA